jgi:hypothetical protein
LNYSFGSASLPSKVWSLNSPASVITALGASINSATGVLSITAATIGDYVLTVEVSNASGCIFGTLDVTVTVGAETCVDPVITCDPVYVVDVAWEASLGANFTVQVTATPASDIYLTGILFEDAADSEVTIDQDGLITLIPGESSGVISFDINALNGTCLTTFRAFISLS